MPSKETDPPRIPITSEVDGKSYSGVYYIKGSMVTVEYRSGVLSQRKGAQVSGVAVQAVARVLLRELVREDPQVRP